MNKNTSLGAYGIMYVVINKKSDVLGLLLRNGVVVPSNASDINIALAVTNLLKVSKSFYLEFTKLLISEDTVMSMSANMSGSYANVGGSSQYFDPSVFQGGTPTTTTTPKSPTASPSWLNTSLGLLQTGFQGFLQLDDNKTKRELADASVKISNDEVTKETLTPTPEKGLSTGAIIGISLLGVTVVGLVIYLIRKNKTQ